MGQIPEQIDHQLHTDDEQESEEEKQEPSSNAQKWKNHYSSKHKILFVGEGDFSFSLCLARAFGAAHNLVATSLDSQGNKNQNFEPFASYPFFSFY